MLILGITRGGGAKRAAGLRGSEQRRGSVVPGDIIQEIEGKKVKTVNELLSRLGSYDASETVTLSVLYDGQTRKVKGDSRQRVEPGQGASTAAIKSRHDQSHDHGQRCLRSGARLLP